MTGTMLDGLLCQNCRALLCTEEEVQWTLCGDCLNAPLAISYTFPGYQIATGTSPEPETENCFYCADGQPATTTFYNVGLERNVPVCDFCASCLKREETGQYPPLWERLAESLKDDRM